MLLGVKASSLRLNLISLTAQISIAFILIAHPTQTHWFSFFSLIPQSDHVFWVQFVPRRPERSTRWTPAVQLIPATATASTAAAAATERLPKCEPHGIWGSSSFAAELYGLSDAVPANGVPTSAAAANAASVNWLSWSATTIPIQQHATTSTAIFSDWCCLSDALDSHAIPVPASTADGSSDSSETSAYGLCGYGR